MNILAKLKKQKIIGLAPMAGYTDTAFRQLCKKYGADLVYSEMISADGIYYDSKRKNPDQQKSLQLARFKKQERPILIQIFGKDPHKMARAAKILIEKYDPDGIDINMGCPARKVTASFHGASLMKDPELAFEIVREVKKVTGNKILSVKTRLGWDNKEQIFKFADGLEQAGADMLAIHCRTKIQGFSGQPDWDIIRELKKTINIPILANGGITDWQSALKCLEKSNADGVLIGQASWGRPWIFKEVKNEPNPDWLRRGIRVGSLSEEVGSADNNYPNAFHPSGNPPAGGRRVFRRI